MLRDLLLGLSAAAGAAIFSQIPEFLQQYLQRLGGHLDEARKLQQQAPQLATRVNDLAAAHDSLLAADTLARPFVAIRHLQPDIAVRTLDIFRPAVPLSIEGMVYALLGVALAVLLFNLLWLPFRAMGERSRRGY